MGVERHVHDTIQSLSERQDNMLSHFAPKTAVTGRSFHGIQVVFDQASQHSQRDNAPFAIGPLKSRALLLCVWGTSSNRSRCCKLKPTNLKKFPSQLSLALTYFSLPHIDTMEWCIPPSVANVAVRWQRMSWVSPSLSLTATLASRLTSACAAWT